MELLSVHDLDVVRGGRRLLAGAGLHVRSGDRLGLVAPNGAGKSTLLAVLAGHLPDGAVVTGRVERAPGVRVRRVAQSGAPGAERVGDAVAEALRHVREAGEEMREAEARLVDPATRDLERYGDLRARFEALGGWRAEADAWATLDRLGVPRTWDDRALADLSSGERQRLALGLALADPGDVLLLDEPTARLDLAARRELERRFAALPTDCALIVASHDRAHLDAVTTSTVWLEGGGLRRDAGAFSDVRRRRDVRARGRARRAHEERKEAARLERSAAALRRQGHAGAQIRRKRMERDVEAALDRAERLASGTPTTSTLELPLGAEASGQLTARHLSRLGLFDDVAVDLEPGARVALFAPQGAGVSTLFAMLAGRVDSDDPRGRVRYGRGTRLAHLDAEMRGLDPGASVGMQLERWVPADRARELLARAGLSPRRANATPSDLSGGERTRAGLALVAASEATLVLLDAPDADLDIDALESLEDLLVSTPATILLATHDRVLASAVASEVVALENGRLIAYRGGVEGYLAGRRRREPGLPRADAHEGDALHAAPVPSERPARGTEPDDETPLESVGDASIEALEDALARIDDALLDPWALGEREAARLRARRDRLVDALAVAFDARYAPPDPRHVVRVGGVRWTLERRQDPPNAPDRVVAVEAPDRRPQVEIRVRDAVAHLRLVAPPRSEITRWGAARAAEAATLLLADAVAPRAIQLFAPRADLHDVDGFTSADAGWWLWDRRGPSAAPAAPDPGADPPSSDAAAQSDARTRNESAGSGRRRLRTPTRWSTWSARRRTVRRD